MALSAANPISIVHRDILAAAMLLTRIPIEWPYNEAPNTARSYWAFPLIGIGVAAIPALLGAMLYSLGIPALAAAALMIITAAMMTGGLHQDGLADLGDSFGGHAPEQRLAIMHDSAIGSYGTLALITNLIIQISCLAALAVLDPQLMAQAMIAVAAMSRGMMGLQRWAHTPPNIDGLAGRTGAPDRQMMLIGLLLALLAGIVFLPPVMAAVLLCAGVIITYLLGRFLKAWIGGVNGDGLGATQQISATVMLLVLTALLT